MHGLSGTDPIVTTLSDTITRIEGFYLPGSTVGGTYYPNGSLAYQNNNPGNSIYLGGSQQQGQSGVTRGAAGFAHFPTLAAGRAALEWQVQNYIDRGYDIDAFINNYAPANTKNAAGAPQTNAMSANYKAALSASLGIPINGVAIKQLQTGSYNPSDTTDTTNTDVVVADNTTPASSSDEQQQQASVSDIVAGLDPVVLAAVALGAASVIYLTIV